MIYSPAPLPVSGQLCREFGHMYTTVYDRPWKRLFLKRSWQVCIACDPRERYEALRELSEYIGQS